MTKKRKLVLIFIMVAFFVSVLFSLILFLGLRDGRVNAAMIENGKINAYYIDGTADASIEYGVYSELGNTAGVKATFTRAKDTAVLRQVIDLNDYGENDKLISVMPMPKQYGTADFDRINVRFVDVYDETNYITLQFSCYPDMLNTTNIGYSLAYASNGQEAKGKDKYSDKIFVNQYGCYTFFQFYGANSDYLKNALSICFDIKTNKIFVWDENTKRNFVIVDFDDNTYFGDDLWQGFTTGEVYAKVSVDGFQESETASVLINYYGGLNLSERYIDNSAGAKIEIDFKDYNESDYPKAVVGKKYPLFDATAFDYYTGYTDDITKSVYYNYFSTDRQKMVISKDGTFTPPIIGDYYVVYEATNGLGVKSEKRIKLTAEAAGSGLQLNLSDYESSVTIGENYKLPQVSYTGNKGNVALTYSIINAGKMLTAENGFVRPVKSGDMTVVVSASDYVGQTNTDAISVTVNTTDKPTFIDEPAFPENLVSGNTYFLPEIKAYNYVNESGSEINVKVKVSENGGAAKVLDGFKYTPNVSTNGNVVITYFAELNGKTSEISKTVPIYNTKPSGNLNMASYFLSSDGGTVASESSDVKFNAIGTGSSFKFINSVYSMNFNCEFIAKALTNNIDEFTIRLIDRYDNDNQVKFTYKNGDYGVEFYMNDNYSYKSSISKDFSEGNILTLNFSSQYKTVSYDVASNKSFNISKNLAGDKFDGFKGNEFYVSFEIKTKGANADIAIRKMNGMFFSNATRDYIGPTISFNGDFNFTVSKGETVEISEALIFDVLDGKREGTVTIISPDDEIVSSIDGKMLSQVPADVKYTVKCDQYGVYFVNFNATDTYGNRLMYSYVINVIDKERPVIEVSGRIPNKVKKGDKIYVPEATVTDNNPSNLTYNVYIILADGSIVEFDGSKTIGIVAKSSGTYRIVYYAKDEEGNVATAVYSVMVEE